MTKYKSSIWEMLKVESDFRANTHYHLSLQECATIKCDHHGIWEGGSGSLCIAPGTGKSGVRQEDPPFQKKYTDAQQRNANVQNTQTVLYKPNISMIFGMWNKMHFL